MTFFRPLTLCLLLCCALFACDAKNTVNKQPLPNFATQKGNAYFLSIGNAQFEVLANTAGRMASLKIDGQEMLLTEDKTNNVIWGNVLWSSPQSEWSWPPVATLDSDPYAVAIENDRLVFTSKVDKQTGYQFVKSYGVNGQKNCLSIRYSIYNQGATEKNVAAWEVTRLHPAGTAFFPQGNTETSNSIFYPFFVEHQGDITWATYDAKKIRDNHHKLMTDAKEGWLAYAYQGKVFVKEFADVPVELMVAGEGEVEIFANKEKTFWEVAQQSVMATLAPGEHLDWEVLWHTRALPNNIPINNGSTELLNFTKSVLAGQN